MIKGFALNDERLKNNGDSPYFEELLARIRDIRTSEKVFWRKVLDIYATSIDYNPKDKLSIDFFKTVQNKIHYATHGNTAVKLYLHELIPKKIIQDLLVLKEVILLKVKLKQQKTI